MFVGVVALRYQHHTTHVVDNWVPQLPQTYSQSHNSQSPLTTANHVCLQQKATLNKLQAEIYKQKEKIIKQQANKTSNQNKQLAWRTGTP